MITTGREYDRLMIAVVVVALVLLAVYMTRCNQKQSAQLQKQATVMSDRMDYITGQVDDARQDMSNWMKGLTDPEPPTDSSSNAATADAATADAATADAATKAAHSPETTGIPLPVSSTFLG